MEEELFELAADSVIVEVTDPKTGKVYRRELPIDYYENANFLRLSGENLDGSLSQLIFYTARGIERMQDITGRGADRRKKYDQKDTGYQRRDPQPGARRQRDPRHRSA